LKKLSSIILILAIVSIAYGYWGAFTESGNKVYDEMDAMFPFLVLIAGVIILLIVLVIFMVRMRKRKS
jgi:heme/copper-type cytochrome/quinol oxidase subunit 2